MTNEEWRAVVGYEGLYEVSDQGRVRSVPRVIKDRSGRQQRWKGKVLALAESGRGKYFSVGLPGGRTAHVHVLVAAAFIGLRPDGLEVCHGNGDHHDNRAENLRYGTPSDNMTDRVRHGTHHQTRKTHCAQNHPYDAANTAHYRGHRICRECRRARSLAYYHRQRSKAA